MGKNITFWFNIIWQLFENRINVWKKLLEFDTAGLNTVLDPEDLLHSLNVIRLWSRWRGFEQILPQVVFAVAKNEVVQGWKLLGEIIRRYTHARWHCLLAPFLGVLCVLEDRLFRVVKWGRCDLKILQRSREDFQLLSLLLEELPSLISD